MTQNRGESILYILMAAHKTLIYVYIRDVEWFIISITIKHKIAIVNHD